MAWNLKEGQYLQYKEGWNMDGEHYKEGWNWKKELCKDWRQFKGKYVAGAVGKGVADDYHLHQLYICTCAIRPQLKTAYASLGPV